MSLMGLAIGTGQCRATVVAHDGAVLSRAHQNYDPQGLSQNVLDVQSLWRAVRATISRASSEAKHDPVTALSVASMAAAITPLSAEGRALGGCYLGSPERGAQGLAEIEGALGRERLFDITGRVPSPMDALPQLLWLCRQNPQLFRNTWRFVLTTGLIDHLLGGTSACDHTLADGTLLFDSQQKRWSRSIAETCGALRFKLPELAPAGQAVGTVEPALASQLGLGNRVQIILGARDLVCGALGAGVLKKGMALYHLGGTMYLMPTFQALPLRQLMFGQGLSVEHHVVADRFVTLLENRSGGSVLQWVRDQIAATEAHLAQKRGYNIYTRLLQEMPDAPTDLQVIPDFGPSGPPRFSTGSHGAIVGLRLSTTRGEVVKALLEGATYYFAAGLGLLEKAGIRVERLRVSGGGAHSDAWLQLVADIMGVPVERTTSYDTTSLGAAMIAGVGSGVYQGYEDAAEALVSVSGETNPDPHRQAIYRDKVQENDKIYRLLVRADSPDRA